MTGRLGKLTRVCVWLAAFLVTLAGVLVLEDERLSVWQKRIETTAGPVEIYTHTSGSDGPLVFVTHGFAGSHQMMQYISRDLARAGYIVAAFDFYGHGRNTALLSPDVSRIEGTTSQLVTQTRTIIDEVRTEFGLQEEAFALLGHSMATDIIIRAAQETGNAQSIVAISMYSDVVTADYPKNLLILSGQWEGRLRDVGLHLVSQVDPQGVEGQTVSNGPVLRRAVAVPFTEHVAVLFSHVTQKEIRSWFGQTLDAGRPGRKPVYRHGIALLAALGGIVALFVLSLTRSPLKDPHASPVALSRFAMALILPAVFATGAAAVGPANFLGMSAFGTLFWFLLAWGAVQLVCIGRGNMDKTSPSLLGMIVLLLGSVLFAVALDRYVAAFVPTGVRLSLLAALIPATVLFMLADVMLVQGASLWRRIAARGVVLGTLGICMMVIGSFGLLFTVLPVLGLFYLVYGTMGRAVAQRFGPMTVGLALGIVLAWSIAASTPLFTV